MINLNVGEQLTNEQLAETFGCSTQGGMRRSLSTGTLVIVSDHIKSVYEDRWIDGVMHYTGMGLVGDQSVDHSQNRTLAQSDTNGVNVHLFEKFEVNRYTYCGQVQLAAPPYYEQQPDQEGDDRQVVIFPLKPLSGKAPVITEEQAKALYESKIKKAKTLKLRDLAKIAQRAKGPVKTRQSQTNIYDRDPWVSEYAKRRADGICQLCELPAPFKNKQGQPFLESHHIIWLSKGGDDSVENTVALCPNCHKKMHVLDLKTDVEKLKKRNQTLGSA